MGTAKRERQKAGRQSRREEAVATARKKRSRQQLRTYAIMAGLIIAVALFFVLRGGGDDDSTASSTTGATGGSGATTTTVPFTTTYGTTPCPPTDGSGERKIAFADSFMQCIDPAKTYTATIKTNKGDLVVDLDAKNAPITVNNFVSLARSKFYDAVPCHRIIPAFVAQCGDPQGTGAGGPGYKFGDELPAKGAYKVGSLAMANSGPNTNGSQFFIITGAKGVALDPNYSLFGQAKPGQEAVIAALDAAGSDANNGVPPKEPVGLTSVTITES